MNTFGIVFGALMTLICLAYIIRTCVYNIRIENNEYLDFKHKRQIALIALFASAFLSILIVWFSLSTMESKAGEIERLIETTAFIDLLIVIYGYKEYRKVRKIALRQTKRRHTTNNRSNIMKQVDEILYKK